MSTANGLVDIQAGGAYISPRSLSNLTNYIIDLQDCAALQASAGVELPGTLGQTIAYHGR